METRGWVRLGSFPSLGKLNEINLKSFFKPQGTTVAQRYSKIK
jgi:hypothetical protein